MMNVKNNFEAWLRILKAKTAKESISHACTGNTDHIDDVCYYCNGDPAHIAVCNDWGNIPLCNNEFCLKKFLMENVSQFFILSLGSNKDGSTDV